MTNEELLETGDKLIAWLGDRGLTISEIAHVTTIVAGISHATLAADRDALSRRIETACATVRKQAEIAYSARIGLQ